MERCPNCGAETRPGDQFCLNCGNRLAGSQPAVNPFPPTAQPVANPFGPPPGMTPGGAPPGQGAPWFDGSSNPPTTPTRPTVQSPYTPGTGPGGPTAPNYGSVGAGFAPGEPATVTAPEILEPTARGQVAVEQEVLERTMVPPPTAQATDDGLPRVSSSDLQTQMEVEEVEVTITSVSESPAKLIVTRNGQAREFLLKKPDISIGRAPSNDVALSGDQLASRRHALIHFDGVNFTIRDLVSANGTYINGVELRSPTVLNNGDHVGVGEHELVFFTVDTTMTEPPTITISAPESSQTSWETIQVSEEADTMEPASALGTQGDSTQRSGALEAAAAPAWDEEAEIRTTTAEEWVETVSSEAPTTLPAALGMPEATIIEPPIVISEDSPQLVIEEEVEEEEEASPIGVFDVPSVNEEDMPLPVPQLPEIPTILSAIKSLDSTTAEMRENLRQAKALEEQAQSLRDQLRAATDAISSHDNSVAVLAQRLRVGVADVSNRLNKVIEEVTRADESLSIAELMKLIDDVRTDPRDIYTLGSLARRARELAQFFELHQHINQILSECLSTLNDLLSADLAKPDSQA